MRLYIIKCYRPSMMVIGDKCIFNYNEFINGTIAPLDNNENIYENKQH